MASVDVESGFEQQAGQEDHENDLGSQQAFGAAFSYPGHNRQVEEIDQKAAADERDGVGDT